MNKDDYKIIRYLKSNPSVFSVLLTLFGITLSGFANYLNYITSYSILNTWGISEGYIPKMNQNQLYLFFVIVMMVGFCFFISSLCVNKITDLYIYELRILKNIVRLKMIEREFNGAKQGFCNDNHNSDKKYISTENDLLNNEYMRINIEIKEVKSLIRTEIISLICSFLVIFIKGGLAFFFMFFITSYYLYDNVIDLVSMALVGSFVSVFLYILLILLLNLMPALRLLKENVSEKFSVLNDQINKMEESRDVSDDYLHLLLKDVFLKKVFISFLFVAAVLLVVLPYSARQSAKENKKYYTTIIERDYYAVIYAGSDEVILKKCVIDNNYITIDSDDFLITNKADNQYEYHKYNRVFVRDID